jgi:small subunit ribosomal protein S1
MRVRNLISEVSYLQAREFIPKRRKGKARRGGTQLKGVAEEKLGQRLEKNRLLLKGNYFMNFREGQIVEGVVKNFAHFGAFIDVGGVKGLLHKKEISWNNHKHPAEILTLGSKIQVKILQLDREKGWLSLGLKQTLPDPWEKAAERYAVGTRVEGRVGAVMRYGLLLELEDGVKGLLHGSNIPGLGEGEKLSDLYPRGKELEGFVLSVDVSRKRISLGLERPSSTSWKDFAERYPPGSLVRGKIKNITDFGLFVEISRGIDGLVHRSDLSWSPVLGSLEQMYRRGQEIETLVLKLDKDRMRISLGLKQIERNPWKDAAARYKIGQVVKGRVNKITRFGAFVEVEPGIDGLVHISNLSPRRVERVEEVVKAGDEIKAVVKHIDAEKRKFQLSIRDLMPAPPPWKKSWDSLAEDSEYDFGPVAVGEWGLGREGRSGGKDSLRG